MPQPGQKGRAAFVVRGSWFPGKTKGEKQLERRIVIVGAGSSGCVLANRLSADPRTHVVLIEAGPDYWPGEVPFDLQDGRRNSFRAHDWGYRHRPTTRQLVFPFPRGRVVGGSSAVNTCIALRGQPGDYDEWAALGLDEWTWEQCLPAFRSIERDLDFDDEYHGRSGPLPIRRAPEAEWTPWQKTFVEACLSLGHPYCEDTNRPHTVGAGPHAMNRIGGRRISAAEAFLTTVVRNRPNLEIRSETLTHRVMFDGTRATGVLVEGSEGVETIHADEVILCGGALNSPGILLRSGIGPPEELHRLGIAVVHDSPGVGRHVLDHPGVAMFLRPRLLAGTSRLHPLIQTTCRYASGTTSFENDIVMQAGSAVPTPWGAYPLVSIMMSVGKPRGVGRLHYRSADLRASPVLDSLLLEDERDRRVAVEGIERAYEISQTTIARKMARPIWPSERVLRDRRRLDKKIYKICDSGYHPCGTAPMGPQSDRYAVCDARGGVRGVEGLHIADASLMPTIPTANIHLSVLMMAERIAHFFLGLE